MRLAVACVVLAVLAPTRPVLAGDDIINLRFRRSSVTAGLHFQFWGEGQRPQLVGLQEIKTVRRTRRRGSHEQDCYWALEAAFQVLAAQARKLGANAVIDVRSNWKHHAGDTPGVFECAIGSWMVGVALRAYVGTIAPPPVAAPLPAAPSAATLAPAPSVDTVTVARDAEGHDTYQVILGNSRVGAKLLAIPDVQPLQVKLALALRAADESSRPHESCQVEVASAGAQEALAAPSYQRLATQETLNTTVSVEQLRKLAEGGEFVICATRIAMGDASQRRIKALLQAIDAHALRKRPVQPGEALSL